MILSPDNATILMWALFQGSRLEGVHCTSPPLMIAVPFVPRRPVGRRAWVWRWWRWYRWSWHLWHCSTGARGRASAGWTCSSRECGDQGHHDWNHATGNGATYMEERARDKGTWRAGYTVWWTLLSVQWAPSNRDPWNEATPVVIEATSEYTLCEPPFKIVWLWAW